MCSWIKITPYIFQDTFEHVSPLRQLQRWSWHILIILFWNGFSFISSSSSLTLKCLNHPHYFNAVPRSSVSHMGFVGKLVYTKQCVYCKESVCKHCNTYWIKGTVMYSLHEEILDEIQFYRISLLLLWMINICLEAACVSMYSDLVAWVFEFWKKYRPTACNNKGKLTFLHFLPTSVFYATPLICIVCWPV